MMEETFLILFLMAVLASGLWCVMDPEAVVRFRARRGWSTSYLSGGFAYANVRRTRFTGSLLVAVVLLVVVIRFLAK
jgi:hypothetical protein